MSAKKLDQSVFEGLPSEYRWAYLDRDGEPFVIGDLGAELDARFPDHRPDCYEDGLELATWMDSVLWRQDMPTAADIDWSEAPEGATHAAKFRDQWGFVFKHDIIGWMVWGGEDWFAMKLAAGEEEKLVKRPESITDVARSIEAARIEEQACMPWPDGDARYFEISPVGQKHDASKPRYSLLPTGSVERVIDVLEFGATKYAPNNWRHVSDARTRYYDATMRHLSAWWQGEKYDAESGLHHLAHAACCILFLLWFERSAK